MKMIELAPIVPRLQEEILSESGAGLASMHQIKKKGKTHKVLPF